MTKTLSPNKVAFRVKVCFWVNTHSSVQWHCLRDYVPAEWGVIRGDQAKGCRVFTPLSTQDYLLKIIDTPGLLKSEQVSALFGNIESIYALNRYVLDLFCLGARLEA